MELNELYSKSLDRFADVLSMRSGHEMILSRGPAILDEVEIFKAAQPGALTREVIRERLQIETYGLGAYLAGQVRLEFDNLDYYDSYQDFR